jgi:hypothetical protein
LVSRGWNRRRCPNQPGPGTAAEHVYAAIRQRTTLLLRCDPPLRRMTNWASRFSRVKFRCMRGVFDSAGPSTHSRCRAPPCCLPVSLTPSAPHGFDVFGAHQLQGYPACICPCLTLWAPRYRCTHIARGQGGSLLLSCMTLSFTTSRRFIPTHPDGKSAPLQRTACTPRTEQPNNRITLNHRLRSKKPFNSDKHSPAMSPSITSTR